MFVIAKVRSRIDKTISRMRQHSEVNEAAFVLLICNFCLIITEHLKRSIYPLHEGTVTCDSPDSPNYSQNER